MFGRVLLSVLAVVFGVFAVRAETFNASAPDFAPGQEWSIKSTSPTTAKVVIGRVETWNDKVAVHVSIVDIPIPQGAPGGSGFTRIDHIPFDKAALAGSVNQLLSTGVPPAPSFEGGYKQWQSAKGGIFTISVEKAIEIMFQTVNRGRA